MINANTGIITTIVGTGSAGYGGDNGQATSATLAFPSTVTVDSSGRLIYFLFPFHSFTRYLLHYIGNIYIADQNAHRIRRVATGIITTYAGTGSSSYGGDGGAATSASLRYPWGVTIDISGLLLVY